MENRIRKKNLLYPELSYQIIGILFEISNALGSKYHERYYQRAVASLFRDAGIKYREQVPVHVVIGERKIARGFIDFLIEEKIILEIKRGERFFKSNIDQVYSYLKASNLKLGILANFTARGLQFKRIINIVNS